MVRWVWQRMAMGCGEWCHEFGGNVPGESRSKSGNRSQTVFGWVRNWVAKASSGTFTTRVLARMFRHPFPVGFGLGGRVGMAWMAMLDEVYGHAG